MPGNRPVLLVMLKTVFVMTTAGLTAGTLPLTPTLFGVACDLPGSFTLVTSWQVWAVLAAVALLISLLFVVAPAWLGRQ